MVLCVTVTDDASTGRKTSSEVTAAGETFKMSATTEKLGGSRPFPVHWSESFRNDDDDDANNISW